LSCLVLSCLVLSCLVLSCLVLSCLVLPCLVLSVLSEDVAHKGYGGKRTVQHLQKKQKTGIVYTFKKKETKKDPMFHINSSSDSDSGSSSSSSSGFWF
jgi:hypothetical protein